MARIATEEPVASTTRKFCSPAATSSRIYPFTTNLEDQRMYFIALATDYDGTEATLEALRELKKSGRKLFLVTGLPA
jgi:hypothetical protein